MVYAARLNPLGLAWQRFFVAEAGGEVVGCAQTKRHGGAIELASLVVAPEWRRRSLGGRLVRLVQQHAGPPLWLTCRAALVPFYRQFGFEEVDTKEEKPRYFRAVQTLFAASKIWTGSSLAVMVWRG
jgi:N-acetylglutamate synthase-like GNAT family acetyltransferase